MESKLTSMDFEIDKTVGNEGEYGVKFNEPTTGEIVRALRDEEMCQDVYWCDKAADRLESQEQTIDDLRETLRITCENWSASSKEKNEKIAVLTARAESAERERDAAVEHIHDAIFGTNHSCFYCTMENCDGCTNSTVKEHFKYRMEKPSKYMTKIED